MNTILPADPGRNYFAHKNEIDTAVKRVFESGRYILGDEVAAFEREFAEYLGVSHAIGVGNGTEAIHLALRACGVGPGDKVITVSHTAVATVSAIEEAGATPVLVDIDPATFTIDPASIERALDEHGENVTAIIPVHIYGHPAPMPAIIEIAGRRKLLVIEDCAQSHGATWHGRKTGTFGHLATFSFYPTKNLGALGDGGAVVTNDSRLAESVRMIRQYGWRTRYVSESAGWNSRLDELQAAILRVKLQYLDAENSERRRIASTYNEAFGQASLLIPASNPEAAHVYHQYTVRSKNRDRLQSNLRQSGIVTAVLYPQPVHLQPAYRERVPHVALPITERVCREILSLPIHPHLMPGEVNLIIEAVHAALG